MVVEKELTRILTLLRNKIRERGFTQLEVQDTLGWGRSYISQLLTKQKSLRVEQVLLILKVIGVEPSEFYGELYHFVPPESVLRAHPPQDYEMPSVGSHGSLSSDEIVAEAAEKGEAAQRSLKELKAMIHGLIQVLLDKNLVNVEELSDAVKESEASTPRDKDPVH